MEFDQVYNLTFDNIFKYFYYKGIDKHEVKDLCQDVFMRFYEKYNGSGKDLSEIKKILYGISRNVYKEWVRAKVKRKEIAYDDDIGYEVIDYEIDKDNSDEIFEEKLDKLKAVLIPTLDTLNPRIKSIIQMRFFENMSRREIANILKITESNVHVYQQRGIKYLTKLLKAIQV